jgi:hypothetical protein
MGNPPHFNGSAVEFTQLFSVSSRVLCRQCPFWVVVVVSPEPQLPVLRLNGFKDVLAQLAADGAIITPI